ncbi:hypothetical protein VM1G_11513 [Cytospora mali]|uniref:C2H2-type domain-containing protein n=1 Tax=Cytospora mali TaxID=578113 RepID=A0A194VTD2_CYTMA|nr:hypothetical protein VM1G_11513 [Valsa mali]
MGTFTPNQSYEPLIENAPGTTVPTYFTPSQEGYMDNPPLSGGLPLTDGTLPTQSTPSDKHSFPPVFRELWPTIICVAWFSKHYRNHRPPLECPHDTCDKKLPENKDLKRHILSNHLHWAEKKPELAYLFKKYECDNCGYATNRPDNLKRHNDKGVCQKEGYEGSESGQ